MTNILTTKKRVSYNPFKMILPYLMGIFAVSLIFITGILNDPLLGPLYSVGYTMYYLIGFLFIIGFVVGWVINSVYRTIRG